MATAEQVKSLIRSHQSDDPERFLTVALQVAAHEAVQGHGGLAHEIREMVDRARQDRTVRALLDFPADLEGIVTAEHPTVSFSGLVLPEQLVTRIRRILQEYLQREKLKQHGLRHRRKILLTGPPGTGKTLTARVIAHELRLPLNMVQVDKLVTKYMGETSAKLRQVFELVKRQEGVYLFDEFDAIGGGRTRDNDVGEMRRVLNALLQFIEHDTSDSLIVAATNSPELLDKALFRRFDDVLHYVLPSDLERKRLIGNVLGTYAAKRFGWRCAVEASAGLSSAETVHACLDALKEAILHDQKVIIASALKRPFLERRQTHQR